jgi:RHS repeat-associated protein
MIGYLYAPNGPRLGKGTITKTFSCDVTKNGMLTGNTLALTTAYNVAPNGDLLEETDGNFNLKHFNVFWDGKLLGTFAGTTYSQSNWAFSLNDWLGTKRQVTKAGTNSTAFFSGPFGDYLSQSGSGSDPSDQHFTGKERDSESSLDYFGARHYSSYLGRFMGPDSSDETDPVPYADFANPQSLNLYSYLENGALSGIDADGHSGCDQHTEVTETKVQGVQDGSSFTFGTQLPCLLAGTVSNVSSSLQQASQAVQSAAHQVFDYLSAPRDLTCLNNATAGGAGAGAATGATLGLAGGPFSEVTVPGGAVGGFGVGGATGFAMGFSACKTGGGVGTGGPASGGGKHGTFWKNLKNFRKGIKTDGKRFYEWDYTHGDIEVYNSQGRHLGSANPETGVMTKPAVPGRTIDL